MKLFRRPTEFFWRTLVLSLVVGAVAGALGAVATWSSLLAYQDGLFARGPTPLTSARRGAADEEGRVFRQIQPAAARSLALIFAAHRDPDDPYLPQEALGSGLVLTSDGWIITHASALSAERLRDARVGVGPVLARPRTVLEDKETGVIFLKVEAQNLQPAVFENAESVRSGDGLVAFFGEHQIYGARVLHPWARSAPVARADVPEAHILFDAELPREIIGGPLWNRDGKVAGVVIAAGDSRNLAVPTAAIRPLFEAVLAGSRLERPELGAAGIHLVEGWLASGGRSRGFLLAGDKVRGLAAVSRGGPAALAGLREGDIVIKLNDHLINGDTDFASLLLAFRPRDKVELTIVRGGEELVVPVTLGSREVDS